MKLAVPFCFLLAGTAAAVPLTNTRRSVNAPWIRSNETHIQHYAGRSSNSSLNGSAPLTETRRSLNATWIRPNETRAQRYTRRRSKSFLDLDTRGFHKTNDGHYRPNWAGAVLVGNGFTSVTAEVTVPRPYVPSSASSHDVEHCACAWVGIDGDTCPSAILQTGIDLCAKGDSVSFNAWYEWYPDVSYNFHKFGVSVGDTIRMTVNASSKTTGSATVENMSNGQKASHTFSEGVQGELCETNAEWIVEDFNANGSLVPFADFGNITFSGAEATTEGSTMGPADATVIDIRQGDEMWTSSSASENEVTVKYLGKQKGESY